MPININSGFALGAATSIDDRIVLTKEQMLNIDENVFPDVYFCVCRDDGVLYLFNKNNVFLNGFGKFRPYNEEISVINDKILSIETTVEGHTTSIDTLQTSIGDKANISDVYTKNQVDDKISGSVSSVYKYKGNVASFSDLDNVESPENGHVYFVVKDSLNYVYLDGSWNPLANIIDLSDYVTDSDMTAALEGKANITDIKTKTSQLENDSEFATESYVIEQIENIPAVDLTDYAITSEIKAAIQNNRKLAALMAYMKCDDIKASSTAIHFVRSGAERTDGGYDMQEKDCRFTTGTSDTGSISIIENIVTLCDEIMIQITFEDYVDHLKFECYVPFDGNITGTATYENQTFYYGSGDYATSLDDDSYIVTID